MRKTLGSFLVVAVVAVTMGLVISSQASAVSTLYWDANGAMGGTGTWDTTTTDWKTTSSSGAANSVWTPNDGTAGAVFQTTAGTVSVGANVNTYLLEMVITGCTLQDCASTTNAITLYGTSGACNIWVKNGTSQTITAILNDSGAAGLNMFDCVTILKSSLIGGATIGTGTLILAGPNIYTGNTSVNEGTLKLDFSNAAAPTNNILYNGVTAGSLVLGGAAAFQIQGKASTTDCQTFGGLTLNAGPSTFTATIGASGTVNVVLGGITRNAQGTVDFTLPATGAVTTSSPNAGGILGGYATVSGNTWAYSNSGTIAGLPVASYGDYSVAGNNVDDCGTGANTCGVAYINSLRFNNNTVHTLTLNNNVAVTTGGVLATSTVGNKAMSISGNQLTSANGQDLVVINNNAGTNPFLTINSVITDCATGGSPASIGLTKVGVGGVALANTNSYTGTTLIGSGTLQATANNALGYGPVTLMGTLQFTPGAPANTLTFDRNQTISGIDDVRFGSIVADCGITTFNGPIVVGQTQAVSFTVSSAAGELHLTNANCIQVTGTGVSTGYLSVKGPGKLYIAGAMGREELIMGANGLVVLQNAAGWPNGTYTNQWSTNNTAALWLDGTTYGNLVGIGSATNGTTVVGTGNNNTGAIRNLSGNNSFTTGHYVAISGGDAMFQVDCNSSLTLSAVKNSGSATYTLTLQGGLGRNPNSSGAIAGAITDGGAGKLLNILKTGTGTWTIGGTGNTYGGTTTVNAGTLVVNGTYTGAGTGAFTVQTGGTLGGSGTILGPITVNGGNYSPGTSPGKMTLRNLAFTSSLDNCIIDIASATSYDCTLFRVSVAPAGANLIINDASYRPTATVGDKFWIFYSDNVSSSTVVPGFSYAGNALDNHELFTTPSNITYEIIYDIAGSGLGSNNNVELVTNAITAPEPATMLLLGTGALGALGWMRRRRVK